MFPEDTKTQKRPTTASSKIKTQCNVLVTTLMKVSASAGKAVAFSLIRAFLVLAALHPLHQTERDEETARLGGKQSQASGRVPRFERECSREEGGLRVQETVSQVSSKVGCRW